MSFETVVGLEVHAQLSTRTKAFCGCAYRYGEPPNTLVCPVCTGQPGTLPVLNAEAVELAGRVALAVGARVRERSVFARKNYFYPDNPKNYQISQYDLPFCEGGGLPIEAGGGARRIGLTRIHLEEDAGKLIHPEGGLDPQASWVDFNRAGVPLIEIVSEPQMRSGEEAHAYLVQLKQLLEYLEVCDCNMEEGSLRCDVNVSVRPAGATELGEKFEIKNLNSFRSVQRAIECYVRLATGEDRDGDAGEHDLAHHLDRGSHTLAYDPAADRLTVLRSKEEAHDYRYFPEPDLPPLVVTAGALERTRAALPELPWDRRARFQERYVLRPYDAQVLTATRPLADYFEAAVAAGAEPRAASSWIQTEVLGSLARERQDFSEFRVPPARLAELLGLVKAGTLSGKMAKDVFAQMAATGKAAGRLVAEQGLQQVSDPGALEAAVQRALAQHGDAVASYLKGKEKSFTFLVGMVMKETQGRANPALVHEALARALDALRSHD
ncbi:MAG TPA: Asp-tRNA(Asn)/Glu-tRNA(Gln) amidotransferase subunit GatB [Candidatus Saccharimonadales bacterium]|nr:Asp-tRNA(Asn)/Glu-tRNA(Gln) amidotransferase subunit GatB [Candidatus Saccharimonadales bacterium]